jgi:hypothetical protein
VQVAYYDYNIDPSAEPVAFLFVGCEKGQELALLFRLEGAAAGQARVDDRLARKRRAGGNEGCHVAIGA